MKERTVRLRKKMDLLSRNSGSAIMFGLLLLIAGVWCAALDRPGGVLLALLSGVLVFATRVRGNPYAASMLLFAVLAWPVQPFEVTLTAAPDGDGPRLIRVCDGSGSDGGPAVRKSGPAACMELPPDSTGFEPGYYLVW